MTSVLFVCMGNICRSPTAEAVFRAFAAAAGVEVAVDSAGTGGWHAGEPPDRRARDAAARRGYLLAGTARQVRPADFAEHDLIVAMDPENLADLLAMAPPGAEAKVRLLVPEGVPGPLLRRPAGFRPRHRHRRARLPRTAGRAPCGRSARLTPAPLEAAGLRWLADGGARVPTIVRDEPGLLELEYIEPGGLSPAGEEDLGRMLATLHAAGAPRFGSLPAAGRFLVGRCELESPEGDDWNSYYLAHRCLPLARRVGLADVVARVRVEAPAEPPARLHGDLWTGNVLAGRDGLPRLIDLAAYGGHREMDLAMLDLFGTIPARTAAAYDEVRPLADGWRERIALWQLFPLLVHAVLFGGGYLRQSRDLADRLAR